MTYTRHGHHIPGSLDTDEHGQVSRARCGGPAICSVCQKDVAIFHNGEEGAEDFGKFFEDTSEYDKDPDRFLKAAKLFVISAHNNRVFEPASQLDIEQLYIVSFTYILGGYKAMISTTVPGDGLYFEVTHNAAKQKTYVDSYIKVGNDKFSPEGE